MVTYMGKNYPSGWATYAPHIQLGFFPFLFIRKQVMYGVVESTRLIRGLAYITCFLDNRKENASHKEGITFY